MRLCQPWYNIFIFSSFDVLQSLVISARVPLNGGSRHQGIEFAKRISDSAAVEAGYKLSILEIDLINVSASIRGVASLESRVR
jgi:hypothetical protein